MPTDMFKAFTNGCGRLLFKVFSGLNIYRNFFPHVVAMSILGQVIFNSPVKDSPFHLNNESLRNTCTIVCWLGLCPGFLSLSHITVNKTCLHGPTAWLKGSGLECPFSIPWDRLAPLSSHPKRDLQLKIQTAEKLVVKVLQSPPASSCSALLGWVCSVSCDLPFLAWAASVPGQFNDFTLQQQA